MIRNGRGPAYLREQKAGMGELENLVCSRGKEKFGLWFMKFVNLGE
jgi:hypothetical protein